MRIFVQEVVEDDKRLIKRLLKGAFKESPAVVVLANACERKPRAAVPVTVANGPKDKADRERVAGIIDGVLMRVGYRFCSISFGNERVRKAETKVPGWNRD